MNKDLLRYCGQKKALFFLTDCSVKPYHTLAVVFLQWRQNVNTYTYSVINSLRVR